MNREKPYFLKRVIAYLIDIIIVLLLSGVIARIFINTDNYDAESRKLMELTKNLTEEKITREEYNEESKNINYYLTKEGVPISIVNCSITIIYYVVMCFYCGGITLGKYIMKLRIVSANDKKLNLGNYLLRSLPINLVLYYIVSVTMVLVLSKDSFMKIYDKISSAFFIFLLATLVFIMYREDGRGLHDLIANTKIISTKKDTKEVCKPDDVVEAKVIEKKKTTNKKSKKERV